MTVLSVALVHQANGAKGLVALVAVALAFLLIGRPELKPEPST